MPIFIILIIHHASLLTLQLFSSSAFTMIFPQFFPGMPLWEHKGEELEGHITQSWQWRPAWTHLCYVLHGQIWQEDNHAGRQEFKLNKQKHYIHVSWDKFLHVLELWGHIMHLCLSQVGSNALCNTWISNNSGEFNDWGGFENKDV